MHGDREKRPCVSTLHFSVDGTGTRLQRGSVPGQAGGHSSL